MANNNYRLNIYELPKIKVTLDNGVEVLVKGALDESTKYNRINTYMLYLPTTQKGVYRVLICNWDVNYDTPAAKLFLVNIPDKNRMFVQIAEPKARANAALIINKYNEIVASHRRKTPVIATTANSEDEAYTEEVAE